jgi:serine/threonine protein kinase
MEENTARTEGEAWADAPDATLQAGQVIDGKYRVDYLVGQGGMAAVWAGANIRTGKRVALKVILQSFTNTPGAEGLLHSEGLAASRINHPNVVTVFDVIEHEGMACIVMELLSGEPLGSYIALNGALSVSEATALLLPAMRGVAAAHAQGVIHRDLKPENIFICIGPDGRVVTTKVLDFGISLLVERVRDPSAGLKSGLVGTPAYMSPEQISGTAEIDERADVYGFGVLLYEALTGQPPFPGEPGSDLLRRILDEPAPPLREIRPDLPPGVVRIIETAMAKEPDQRYSNLNLMVSALEDEMMLATPLPRSLTPHTGLSSSASHDPSSEHLVPEVQAILKKEPSGAHQETRTLFGYRTDDQSHELVPLGAVDVGWRYQLEPPASLLPAAMNSAIRASAASSWSRLDGQSANSLLPDDASSRFSARGRRELAGAGGVLLLAFGVWMAMRDVGKTALVEPAPSANIAPVASENPAPPTVPAATPAATAQLVQAAVPLAVAPSVLEPSTRVAASHRKPASRERAARGSAIPGRSRLAMREPPKSNPFLRRPAQGQTKAIEPTSGAATPARPAEPRAGSLSADDF